MRQFAQGNGGDRLVVGHHPLYVKGIVNHGAEHVQRPDQGDGTGNQNKEADGCFNAAAKGI